jgi:hypothetical protein
LRVIVSSSLAAVEARGIPFEHHAECSKNNRQDAPVPRKAQV